MVVDAEFWRRRELRSRRWLCDSPQHILGDNRSCGERAVLGLLNQLGMGRHVLTVSRGGIGECDAGSGAIIRHPRWVTRQPRSTCARLSEWHRVAARHSTRPDPKSHSDPSSTRQHFHCRGSPYRRVRCHISSLRAAVGQLGRVSLARLLQTGAASSPRLASQKEKHQRR